MNLRGFALITTDDASCFGTSWLSTNASVTDFPQYTFSKAAILSESRGSNDCRIWRAYSTLRGMEGGAYARDELIIRANTPSPLLSKSSVQNGGHLFWSLWY